MSPIFDHRLEANPSRKVYWHWLALTFSAGSINAGGFLAAGRFVSHVTGFATLFGVDLAVGQVVAGFGILSVPLFFMGGGMLAGLLIDRPIFNKKQPHFDWVMGISAACLIAAAVAGSLNQWGMLGKMVKLRQAYWYLALLCLSSGLQNAAITTSSGNSVRTTHLTGLTTDIGLGIARIFTLSLDNPLVKNERGLLKVRFATIVAFICGSVVGALLFIKFRYLGFLLPASIALYFSFLGRQFKLRTRFDHETGEI